MPAETPALRVLVADDHPIFREGLRMLLASVPDITVVAEAGLTSQAVALAAEHRPDVVVLDVDMPEDGGLAALPLIQAAAPESATLMLTMLADEVTLAGALRAGASGYVLKGAGQQEVVAALRSVAAGALVVSAGLAAAMRSSYLSDTRVRLQPFPQLTDREREVTALVGRGLANPAIAQRLFLSPKTVRNLVSAAMAKLDIHDRTTLAIRARDAGLG